MTYRKSVKGVKYKKKKTNRKKDESANMKQ